MPTNTSSNKAKKMEPIIPDQLEEMNIEDFITGELEQSDRKLELFDEKRIATALGDYVLKQQAQAIPEVVNALLGKQQKHLIKQGPTDSHDSSNSPQPKAESKEGQATSKGDGGHPKFSSPKSDSDDVENRDIAQKVAWKPGRTAGSKRTASVKSRAKSSPEILDSDEDSISKSASKSRRAKPSTGRGRKMPIDVDISDDEYIEEVSPPKAPPASSRRARTTTTKRLDSFASDDSHDDNEAEEMDDPPPRKKTARARKSSPSMSQSSKSGSRLSQSQLSFAPVKRGGNSRKRAIVNIDSDEEDQDALNTTSNSYELDEDWGTAKTDTFRS
jgi:hypothetical protein